MGVVQGDTGGGGGTDATITMSDITTNNASASQHGFLLKLANTSTKFLRDDGSWQTIAGGGDALVANPLSQFAATTSAQLAGVITNETGSGSLVFATTPTLVTPVLGVATATSVNKVAVTAPATASTLTIDDGFTLHVSANATVSGTNTGDQTNITGNAATVTTNANLTGPVTSTGNATAIASGAIALAKLANGTAGNVVTYDAAGVIAVAATGTSGQALLSNGPGTAPTFQTLPGGGDALTAHPLSQFAATTSLQFKGVISDETGSGAVVFATSPTLVTPTLGVAAATTVNKVTLTAPASGSTLTISDGVTLTCTASVDTNNLAPKASPTFTGTVTTAALAVGNSNITGVNQLCFNSEISAGNKTGATQNLADWTTGSAQTCTLTGNCTGTSTMTSPTGVSRLTLRIVQDGTGSRTISTWPATVKWAGGAAPTLTTAASGIDIITFYWNGTNYFGVASLAFA